MTWPHCRKCWTRRSSKKNRGRTEPNSSIKPWSPTLPHRGIRCFNRRNVAQLSESGFADAVLMEGEAPCRCHGEGEPGSGRAGQKVDEGWGKVIQDMAL